MRVHFIAIGGSVLFNRTIVLHKKGYQVTGVDNKAFEPLNSHGNKAIAATLKTSPTC